MISMRQLVYAFAIALVSVFFVLFIGVLCLGFDGSNAISIVIVINAAIVVGVFLAGVSVAAKFVGALLSNYWLAYVIVLLASVMVVAISWFTPARINLFDAPAFFTALFK